MTQDDEMGVFLDQQYHMLMNTNMLNSTQRIEEINQQVWSMQEYNFLQAWKVSRQMPAPPPPPELPRKGATAASGWN